MNIARCVVQLMYLSELNAMITRKNKRRHVYVPKDIFPIHIQITVFHAMNHVLLALVLLTRIVQAVNRTIYMLKK